MDICASMTAAFGVASLNSVGRMGASSSIRVRRSNETGFIAGVSPVMAHSIWKQLGFHKGWHGTPVKPPISFYTDIPYLIRWLTAQRRHQEENQSVSKGSNARLPTRGQDADSESGRPLVLRTGNPGDRRQRDRGGSWHQQEDAVPALCFQGRSHSRLSSRPLPPVAGGIA